ncbi:SDR family oxidoreductase [Chitinibacteraceae bacterium HSL-7]
MATTPAAAQHATVLLTGITGFLAGHIALQLLQQGHRVRGSVRSLASGESLKQDLRAAGANVEALSFVLADLNADDGWAEAVRGCDYVIHAASPFPAAPPKDENELIGPARAGTLRVLQAAQQAGVRRVVLTSSIAAINYGDGTSPFTEQNWTDINGPRTTAYYKSKTVAEQAAWAFARESGLELSVINPSLILGPLLSARAGTSVDVVRKMLTGGFPALPRFGLPVVDVRDVAAAHVLAMTHPDAAGERFIASAGFMWFKDIADVLRTRLPDASSRVPKLVVPNWLVHLQALFDPLTRLALAELGLKNEVSNTKAQRVLGWHPRPEADAIVACAESLLAQGLIETGPKASRTPKRACAH